MTLVYDPNSRRMVPRAELLMMEQSIIDASEKPQKQQRKKKQQQSTAAVPLAGSHLSQGTMTHAHGSAAPLNRAEVQRAAKEPKPHRKPQESAPEAVQVQAPEAVLQSPPSPELQPATMVSSAPVEEPQDESAQQVTEDRGDEESAHPLPALSTTASTPSSSASSLPALAASQLATTPVAIKNTATSEDGGFEGTALTEDERPVLAKRPSIVREEPDLEAEEEQPQQSRKQQTTRADSQTKLSSTAAVVAAAAAGSRTARDDLDGVSAPSVPQHDGRTAPQQEQDRTRSNSPVRTARFSTIVGNNLTIRRHSPPPRSISPRKSALKHSGPRDASPSDSASDAATNPSNMVGGDVALSNRKKAHRVSFDDKAVVVSQAPLPPSPPRSPGLSSLPGASEAPLNSHTAHQPPSRSRSWFSNIGRGKKKADQSAASGDDDDMAMKPRPALPSFGSVRDKSHPTQQEERPLVRPTSESQLSATRQPFQPLEAHSTSSDHAVGFIVGAERQTSPKATRNTANTSRYREPLPPVVTSVDGNGYVSDSADSTNEDDVTDVAGVTGVADVKEHSPVLRFDEAQETTVPATPDEPIIPATSASKDMDDIIILPGSLSPTKSPKETVPAIAISHPSQEDLAAIHDTRADDAVDEQEQEQEQEQESAAPSTMAPAVTAAPAMKNSPVRPLFDLPGTFPLDSESDGTTKSSPTHASFAPADLSNQPVPIRQNAFEPITQDDDLSYSAQMPGTVFATHMPTLHEEISLRNEPMGDDDSDSEVFSDAYEDLSDIEGDGFLSLDAVVDSPMVPALSSNSPFSGSPLTGSPSRKSDAPQPVPSPLAKEAAPAVWTNGSSMATAANTNNTVLPAVAAGGAVIGMAAIATTAMNKQLNGGSGPRAGGENEEDWEKIKAFWRGLTTEKRAQLEKEAKEEAATEGDLEDESAAADKKPRRKKSVEKRIAEKKAIQELTPARQEAARQETAAATMQPQSQKPAATRIRRSMRDNSPADSAGVSATQTPTPHPVAGPIAGPKERVASSALPPKAAVGAVTRPAPPKMHARTMSADSSASSMQGKSGVISLLPSALRRRGSDSSESSFRRGAATSGAAEGASGFRTSMRGDTKPAAAPSSGTSSGNLNTRSSRFSLRSLSPTGSTTLRGSAESSPAHFRRSMRDGAGSSGFAAMDTKRMSSTGSMASSTLRKSAAADSGGGGLFSLGKKRGGKLLQRSKDQGSGSKSGRSRFDSSDDDDDDDNDIFGPSRASNGAAAAAYRRSASAGGAFRSRFVDSSDEDEDVGPSTLAAGARRNTKEHVVPKTLRTGSSMRSASARPASLSTPLSPLLPEEVEEVEEDEKGEKGEEAARAARSAVGPSSSSSSSAAVMGVNDSIGTKTLRRSRSGRGQIVPASPSYSPTTTGAVGLNGSMATPTRRSSGIMSVLRRKKNDSPVSPTSISNGASGNKIRRAGLVDSAARRDTQLERSSRELAAVRSNSRGSQGRRTMRGAAGGALGGDSDDDLDSDDGRVVAADSWPLPGPNTNGAQAQASAAVAADESPDKKKKKFPGLRRMFRLDD